MISIAAANLSPCAQLIHEVRTDGLTAFKEMLSKDSGERQQSPLVAGAVRPRR
jgi:hypothetical protein